MFLARLRLILAAAAGTGLTVGAALAMASPALLAANVGAGLLCSAVPLTALAAWRAAQRRPAAPTVNELGPVPVMGQMLHIATWAGIATGSAIWLLAAGTLSFPGEAGFWLLGVAGVVVGSGMAGATLWSMAHPCPAIRADAAGIAVGGGLVTPWRQIETLRFRRSPWRAPHLEIRLASGEVLRAPLSLTTGAEDLAAFRAVARGRLSASEPVRLAQAVQQPDPRRRQRAVERAEDEGLKEVSGEA